MDAWEASCIAAVSAGDTSIAEAAVALKKIKYPREPGLPLPHCEKRHEQPFYLLKPDARLARALVELDPRHAPAPPINFWHGALHCTDAPELEAGNGATHSLLNLAAYVSRFTIRAIYCGAVGFSRSGINLG
jgi:hypothetical protein